MFCSQDKRPVIVSKATGGPAPKPAKKAKTDALDFLALLNAPSRRQPPSRDKKAKGDDGPPPPPAGPADAMVMTVPDGLPEVDFLSLVSDIQDEEQKKAYTSFREELMGMVAAGEEQVAELWANCFDEGDEVDDDQGEHGGAEGEGTGSSSGTSSSSGSASSTSAAPPLPPPALPPPVVDPTSVDVMQIGDTPTVTAAPHGKKARMASPWCRDWGLYHINFREPTPACKLGAWSTTCPLHSTADRKCTKSMNLVPGLSMFDGIKKIIEWCNQAPGFDDKFGHMALDPKGLPVRTNEELKAAKITEAQAAALGFEVFRGPKGQ